MTTTITASTRRPRFARDDTQPSRLQLTPRDLEILHLLANPTFRLLQSTDIARLIGGSAKKVIERVGELYYAKYIDRPAAQAEYFRAGGGSVPIVYALSNQGARALAEHDLMAAPPRREWSRLNDDLESKPHVRHALALANTAINLQTASTATNVGLQLGDDLVATLPEKTRNLSKPFKLTVELRHDGKTITNSVETDLAAALVFPDQTRRAYLFEVCRATMPVKRRNMAQTSIYKKLIAYHNARLQGLHRSQFGWKNFRVPLIVPGPGRVDTILKVIAGDHQLKGSPLFLVTDAVSLAKSENILVHQWRTINGTTTLLS